MEEVIIRPMTIKDLSDVMVVEYQSFSSPWSKQDLLIDLTKNHFSHYIVMEKNQRVIGYCGAWIVLDSAQITNIAILPEERGHKYGERLFQYMLNDVKEKVRQN